MLKMMSKVIGFLSCCASTTVFSDNSDFVKKSWSALFIWQRLNNYKKALIGAETVDNSSWERAKQQFTNKCSNICNVCSAQNQWRLLLLDDNHKKTASLSKLQSTQGNFQVKLQNHFKCKNLRLCSKLSTHPKSEHLTLAITLPKRRGQ